MNGNFDHGQLARCSTESPEHLVDTPSVKELGQPANLADAVR